MENKREYMIIIADFFDWCGLYNIEMDDMNDDIINEYIRLKSNNASVIKALDDFKTFL